MFDPFQLLADITSIFDIQFFGGEKEDGVDMQHRMQEADIGVSLGRLVQRICLYILAPPTRTFDVKGSFQEGKPTF